MKVEPPWTPGGGSWPLTEYEQEQKGMGAMPVERHRHDEEQDVIARMQAQLAGLAAENAALRTQVLGLMRMVAAHHDIAEQNYRDGEVKGYEQALADVARVPHPRARHVDAAARWLKAVPAIVLPALLAVFRPVRHSRAASAMHAIGGHKFILATLASGAALVVVAAPAWHLTDLRGIVPGMDPAPSITAQAFTPSQPAGAPPPAFPGPLPPAATPSPSPSGTAGTAAVAAVQPSVLTESPAPEGTASPADTGTPAPSGTPAPTDTGSPAPSPTDTDSASASPTDSPSPADSPTDSPTPLPTDTSSACPSPSIPVPSPTGT